MSDEFYELLKGRTCISRGPVNVGVFDTDEGVILVDSGNDKDAGRKLYKRIRESNRKLKAVFNTHSNADHIGGNAYLQKNAGCEIWAPAVEAAFTEFPMLEACVLWGGFPLKELRTKFFEAKPSRVDLVVSEDTKIPGLNFIALPGHFFNQYGVLTDDGVFFLGDSIFSKEIINKYGLPFIFEVDAYCSSIERIKGIEADFYVPSHGSILTDISETAALNLQIVEDAKADVINLLKNELTFDDLFGKFCDLRNITPDPGQYVLIGSTIRSFLANLDGSGHVGHFFDNNKMYWKSL